VVNTDENLSESGKQFISEYRLQVILDIPTDCDFVSHIVVTITRIALHVTGRILLSL
jgi:hypothetical protein